MARSLHDLYYFCRWLQRIGRQQLAPASVVDSGAHLWDCHGSDAIPDHAACIWTGVRWIKDVESYAGKVTRFDEPHRVWHRSLRFRIAGQLGDIVKYLPCAV
jgi:hypothetical protein